MLSPRKIAPFKNPAAAGLPPPTKPSRSTTPTPIPAKDVPHPPIFLIRVPNLDVYKKNLKKHKTFISYVAETQKNPHCNTPIDPDTLHAALDRIENVPCGCGQATYMLRIEIGSMVGG